MTRGVRSTFSLRHAALVAALLPLPLAGSAAAQQTQPPDEEEFVDPPMTEPETAPIEESEGVIEPGPQDGSPRTITSVEIEYLRASNDQPSIDYLLAATIDVLETSQGYIAPREEQQGRPLVLSNVPDLDTQTFYDSLLPRFAPAVVERLQEYGLIGVYVEPDPTQFRVEDGQIQDLREEDDTSLRLQVTTGIVTDLRSLAMGERIPDDGRLNSKIHARIRDASPVQPTSAEPTSETTSLLRRDLIDDFVFRLNRHPGRRVDVAVAPSGTEQGGVVLDYLVTENRPWLAYFQLSNTGTEATTKWRERFGFIHNQLTDSDDTLIVDYLTGNFDEVNAGLLSYERPLIGTQKLRARAFATWNEFTASELGQPDSDFTGEDWTAGGELIANIAQDRDLFVDFVAGARYQDTNVDNEFAGISGQSQFVIPYAGLRLERFSETARMTGEVRFETNLAGIAGTEQADLNRLGRLDTDPDWVVMPFEFSHAFYLEPVFNPDLDDEASLVHELALSAKGQVAFGNRLTPTAQQTVGGLYTVRGYPQSLVAGDDVFIASAEYRYHVPRGFEPDPQPASFLGRPFRFAPQYQYGPLDWDLILRTFVDFGRSEQNDRLPFENDATLVSWGLGLELAITRHFSFRADWGLALNDFDDNAGNQSIEAGRNEFYFVLTLVY